MSNLNSQAAFRPSRRMLRKYAVRFLVSFLVAVVLAVGCFAVHAQAADVSINISSGDASGGTLGVMEMMFILLLLALAPTILVMMTSFTRIVIVLSFLRNAMGTQQSPPNQIIIGLALFLTLFIMTPVFQEINEQAYVPYREGRITQDQAVENMLKPLKTFMVRQTKEKEMAFFIDLAGKNEEVEAMEGEPLDKLVNLGLEVIVPAFILSELKQAFTIGFLLFIPFLIIDIVVSSTLMSMGMVMLPPSMIALPFKLLTFVLVDGWGQLIQNLIIGFQKNM